MQEAERIRGLNSDIFTEMDLLRKKVEAKGINVINLGIGSPDQPLAPHIKQALIEAVSENESYGYPTSNGSLELRKAISHWYKARFGVNINPENEALVLMGSQDGLSHIAQAFVNPGDYALIPDPHYPIYRASIILAGGNVFPMPLTSKNHFLPDFNNIPEDIAYKAKMMILNYPNNPVAAVADCNFFEIVVKFASKYNILVCHDVAYSELAFEGYKPISFMAAPGARDIGVEFHSLSKTYNMAGCRLGFVVGNPKVLSALARVKSNIDYGVFNAVQKAGIAALTGPQDCVVTTVAEYQKRRDLLVEGLSKLGWKMDKPKATMFIWAPIPKGYDDSKKFAMDLLNEAGVLVIPGNAFGDCGQGYVRIAMVHKQAVLSEAIDRIKKAYLNL